MSDVGEQDALLETLRLAGRIDHVSDCELDRRARRHRRAMTRVQRRERLTRLVPGRRRVVVVCLAAATAVGLAVGSGVLGSPA